jgi:hypothetical protein
MNLRNNLHVNSYKYASNERFCSIYHKILMILQYLSQYFKNYHVTNAVRATFAYIFPLVFENFRSF